MFRKPLRQFPRGLTLIESMLLVMVMSIVAPWPRGRFAGGGQGAFKYR